MPIGAAFTMHTGSSNHGFRHHSSVCLVVLFGIGVAASLALAAPKPVTGKGGPRLEPPSYATFALGGPMGQRIEANVRNWLLTAPAANPGMLQMFRDRDRQPRRDLVPWAGEFAGKYLISAVQALTLTRDQRLEAHLRRFVADLISTQDADGYLGPFPRDQRMMGKGLWDLWGQYHVMLGLYYWYKYADDREALAACRRCADYFCAIFLDSGKRVVHAGSEEMNESCIHIFILLYRETGEVRYLRMAEAITRDWETPPSGDYLRTALARKPFYQTPKPRWESLPGIQAIAEFFFITDLVKYREALEQIWWSILEGDRHTTGGFSSGEQATGNPYDPRPIETCCTIAWMALTVDYLRMTGDARAADELELSTWNAVLGAQNADGRWWTYNTPMDGERKASAHDIVFQARPGTPELNCCSVNGPRGIGMLSEWAVMTTHDGLVLNFYGPGSITAKARSGQNVRFTQETSYPLKSDVRITVSPDKDERFRLYMRIPGWSRQTEVRVNGEKQAGVRPGTYAGLDRTWKAGDVITLTFDFSPRFWVGEREAAGKVAVYRGPVLLAYDRRLGTFNPRQLPRLDWKKITLVDEPVNIPNPKPLLLVRCRAEDGDSLPLCDFASAGAAGDPYVTWLPAADLKPAPFSRENPLRALWPSNIFEHR